MASSSGYFETLLVIIFIARMASLGSLEIFIAFSCFVYLKGTNKFKKWLLRPWSLPILGKLPYLLWDVHCIHDRAAYVLERTKGTYHIKGPWFANMDILATADPANVNYIMSGNFQNYPKGPEFKKIFDVLGDGIFNSDKDLWKIQRKQARALINHQRFHKFLVKTTVTKVEQGLIPVLENAAKTGEVVDMQEVFKRLTFDTTCKMVTGYDPGCLTVEFNDVPFSKAIDDVEEAIFMRHVLPNTLLKLQKWLGIGLEKKLSKACRILDDVIIDIIAKKRQDLISKESCNNHEEGFDLLTCYINEDHEKCYSNQDMFLRDTILNLMIAGRDTTSSALTWFLWLVITNPIVLNQIRDELKGLVNQEEPQRFILFEPQQLRNLPYLHGALCEALRLYPPVPFQHKEPLEPDTLPSGHQVHTKMKVMFSLYAMGRMSFIWGKDSREFKPERWISEKGGGGIKHEPSYKFLAFNAGPRTCLGKEVAFIQMKTVAAAILYNYDIQVVEKHPVVPNVSIILYMKHGLKATVKSRWS